MHAVVDWVCGERRAATADAVNAAGQFFEGRGKAMVEALLSDLIFDPALSTDLALFEPNQRGSRAYDRFLRDHTQGLEPGDSLSLSEWQVHVFQFSAFSGVTSLQACGWMT